MIDNRILALFDIDSTLVRGARCHYQAFVQAIGKYYKIHDDLQGINYAGKTDPEILEEVLQLVGLSRELDQLTFQKCLDFMSQYYQKNVHRENIRLLPGVEKIIPELSAQGILLGLATGNLESIARAKLSQVGLSEYFPFGGFGSDHPQRKCLVKTAIYRARKYFDYRGDKIFVFGDTPRDIAAGKLSSTITVGVATGSYSSQELKQSGADYVLKDLSEHQKIMELLYGNRLI